MLFGPTFNRKGAAGAKGQKGENDSKKSRELRTVGGHDPNAELARLMPVSSRFLTSFFGTLTFEKSKLHGLTLE